MTSTPDDVIARCRWQGSLFSTVEDFELARHNSDWVLTGSVSAAAGEDLLITYEVVADRNWSTRHAAFDARVGEQRRISRLEHADGRWTVDGRAEPALDGCTDVDLGWTPSTNTLPIRRLGTTGPVDTPVSVAAAWVRMPDLAIVRLDQAYARNAPQAWHYRSGSFAADLDVDEFGLVTRYGVDGLWVSANGG